MSRQSIARRVATTVNQWQNGACRSQAPRRAKIRRKMVWQASSHSSRRSGPSTRLDHSEHQGAKLRQLISSRLFSRQVPAHPVVAVERRAIAPKHKESSQVNAVLRRTLTNVMSSHWAWPFRASARISPDLIVHTFGGSMPRSPVTAS